VATIVQTGEQFVEVIRPQYKMFTPYRDQNNEPIEYSPEVDPFRWIRVRYVGPDPWGLHSPYNPEEPIVWADMNEAGRCWCMATPDLIEVPELP
jgi:hypothetical protein